MPLFVVANSSCWLNNELFTNIKERGQNIKMKHLMKSLWTLWAWLWRMVSFITGYGPPCSPYSALCPTKLNETCLVFKPNYRPV